VSESRPPLEGEALIEAGLYWIRIRQQARLNIGEVYKPRPKKYEEGRDVSDRTSGDS
jgi:hypothetical protein